MFDVFPLLCPVRQLHFMHEELLDNFNAVCMLHIVDDFRMPSEICRILKLQETTGVRIKFETFTEVSWKEGKIKGQEQARGM